jgi:molecular chaperone DnaJ
MAKVGDLYAILGVPRDASPEEIRRAYRALARQHHPDVNENPGADQRFKEIAGAYEILSDPQKRQRYDTFGTAGGPGGGAPFTDIQDIFDMFFGAGGFGSATGSRRSRGPRSPTRRGEDVGTQVLLTFPEAAFGVRRELRIERLVACDRCMGNGAEPGTAPIACRTCGGTGEVQEVRRSIFGTIMTASACRTCDGTGSEVLDPCTRCSGRGRVAAPDTVTVDIPAGVADGLELRVSGAGNVGMAGGPAGDLYVGIRVEQAAAFERRGQDLFAILDVSLTQAALGAEVEFEALDGPERVKIAPGTESGELIRVRGKGIPNLNRRGRGDLYVTVHVTVPKDLKREERGLLEQLAEARGERWSKKDPATAELRRPEG